MTPQEETWLAILLRWAGASGTADQYRRANKIIEETKPTGQLRALVAHHIITWLRQADLKPEVKVYELAMLATGTRSAYPDRKPIELLLKAESEAQRNLKRFDPQSLKRALVLEALVCATDAHYRLALLDEIEADRGFRAAEADVEAGRPSRDSAFDKVETALQLYRRAFFKLEHEGRKRDINLRQAAATACLAVEWMCSGDDDPPKQFVESLLEKLENIGKTKAG